MFEMLVDAAKLYTQTIELLLHEMFLCCSVVFTEEMGYTTADVAESKGLKVKKLSGTKFRQMLRGGEDIPDWFAFKSVVQVLRDHQQHQVSK